MYSQIPRWHIQAPPLRVNGWSDSHKFPLSETHTSLQSLALVVIFPPSVAFPETLLCHTFFVTMAKLTLTHTTGSEIQTERPREWRNCRKTIVCASVSKTGIPVYDSGQPFLCCSDKSWSPGPTPRGLLLSWNTRVWTRPVVFSYTSSLTQNLAGTCRWYLQSPRWLLASNSPVLIQFSKLA